MELIKELDKNQWDNIVFHHKRSDETAPHVWLAT